MIVLGDTQEHESTGLPMHDSDGAAGKFPRAPGVEQPDLDVRVLVDPGLGGVAQLRMRLVFEDGREVVQR